MNFYNLSVLLFSFCTLLIGVLIWLKRNDSIGNKHMVFSIAVVIWATAHAVMISNSVSYSNALFAARIANVAAAFVAVTWYHFMRIFTGYHGRSNLVLIACYSIACVLMLFMFSPWFIPSLKPVLNFEHYHHPGPLYYLKTLLFISAVTAGFALLREKILLSAGASRKRLIGFLIASSAGFLGGSLTYLPAYDILIPQFGLFLMPFYPFIIAYFMMKHGLFNVDALAQAFRRDKLASIGILAANVDAEISKPLNAIRAKAFEVTEDATVKDNKIINTMSQIIAEVDRASAMASKLGHFAKFSSSNDFAMTRLDLKVCADNVVALVQNQMDYEKIHLVREIPDAHYFIHADARYIEEILFNLFVNAIRSMTLVARQGKIRLRLIKHGKLIRVEIKDDGPGLTDLEKKQILQPFCDVDDEGMGLGLYATKLLVERNQGVLTVNSKENFGSTFAVEFVGIE